MFIYLAPLSCEARERLVYFYNFLQTPNTFFGSESDILVKDVISCWRSMRNFEAQFGQRLLKIDRSVSHGWQQFARRFHLTYSVNRILRWNSFVLSSVGTLQPADRLSNCPWPQDAEQQTELSSFGFVLTSAFPRTVLLPQKFEQTSSWFLVFSENGWQQLLNMLQA